jgi:hypothetical protein
VLANRAMEFRNVRVRYIDDLGVADPWHHVPLEEQAVVDHGLGPETCGFVF